MSGRSTRPGVRASRSIHHILIAAAAVVLATAGCSDPPEVPLGPDGQPDAVLAEGRDIYSSQCSQCHGVSGGGGRGKALNDGMSVDRFPEIADMIEVVEKGIGSGMPRFDNKLDPDEIEAVVRYVREVL